MELKLLICLLFVLVVNEGRGQNLKRASSEQEKFYRGVRKMSSVVGPLADQGQPINVSVDYTISTVTKLNKVSGYVELEGYLTLSYRDPRYSSLQVDKFTVIRINPKDIWTPDIDLYNGVHPGIQVINIRSSALLYASGDVTIANKIRTRSLCDVMGQHFVKGVNCTVKFGSWAHNGNDIAVGMRDGPDQLLSNYRTASMWNVTKATAWSGADTFPCCPEPFPWVQFSFIIKKRRN